MYIQKDLTITSEYIDGISWEITEDLLAKVYSYGGFSKLIFDEDETCLINVVEDKNGKELATKRFEISKEDALLYAQNKIRKRRDALLNAFDVYKSNVFYGIDKESDEERQEIILWYQTILDLPNLISIDNLTYKWPDIPSNIEKYITNDIVENKKSVVRSRIRG